MDIQQKLTGFAMMGATWIMWLLVGLSVGGVAVALERAIYLILTRENVRKLKQQILALLRKGDLDEARARLSSSRSHVAGIIAADTGGTRGRHRLRRRAHERRDAAREAAHGEAARVPGHARLERAFHRAARNGHRHHQGVSSAQRCCAAR